MTRYPRRHFPARVRQSLPRVVQFHRCYRIFISLCFNLNIAVGLYCRPLRRSLMDQLSLNMILFISNAILSRFVLFTN